MKKLLFFWSLVLLSFGGLAQTGGFGNCNPDSLQAITKSGVVSVQQISNMTHYFLDENLDGTADFRLNFGPFWYQPDEGTAARPSSGDTISISGGLNTLTTGLLPVIVVYSIDGEFWRNPYDPYWNNVNNHYRSNRQGGQGFAPGWSPGDLEDTTLTGKVIIDTTLVYYKYYLDTDNNMVPDYHLNFGPYWYEPLSNIQLPAFGDQVTVEGMLIPKNNLPCLIVLELNDSLWRDDFSPGVNMAGRWLHQNMGNSRRVNCLFDSICYLTIQNGWHGGGMGNDSLFVQMLQLMHQNQPQYQNQNGFMGFEIGAFNGNRQNQMSQNGWRMNFQNNVQYHLHYHQQLLNRYHKDESTIQLKRWNHQNQNWELVQDAIFNTNANTVSFSEQGLGGFYLLSAQQIIGIAENMSEVSFELEAFPNPARELVNLRYFLQDDFPVKIEILDLSGRLLQTQSQRNTSEGINEAVLPFDGLKSGIYIIKVSTQGGEAHVKVIKSVN